MPKPSRKAAFNRLREDAGFDETKVAALKTYSPEDWQGDLNLERGAAFGLSHDFFQSAFFRPNNRIKGRPGLTYVGASTMPGNGLPMVLISAELAEERVNQAFQAESVKFREPKTVAVAQAGLPSFSFFSVRPRSLGSYA